MGCFLISIYTWEIFKKTSMKKIPYDHTIDSYAIEKLSLRNFSYDEIWKKF